MSQMFFVHYDVAIPYDALAENLVNSYIVARAKEVLATPRDLDAFLAEHGIRGRRATAADLQEIRKLRAEVRRIFEASAPAGVRTRLDRLLRRAELGLSLRAEAGRPKLEWTAARSTRLPATVRSAVALNLALALERFGFDRLGVCESGRCREVFVDTTKRGGRRFCGHLCANRYHVSRFRERHRRDGRDVRS